MRRSSAQLKLMARASLTGQYGTAVGITFCSSLISFMLMALCNALFGDFYTMRNYEYHIVNPLQMVFYFIFYIVIYLILYIINGGYIKYCLNLCRKKEARVGNIFYAFSHHPDRLIVASGLLFLLLFLPALVSIFLIVFVSLLPFGSVLAALLLIALYIGIIILLLGFMFVPYLLIDNLDMGAVESLKTSLQMMKGHRGRLFYIGLSFIGWSLLSVCTIGIGSLWLMPYMNTTYAYFYLDVKGELDKQPELLSAEPTESTVEFYA